MSTTPPGASPRANPFGNLDDFAAAPSPKPVPARAIEEIAEASGFPSRKAGKAVASTPSPAPASASPAPAPAAAPAPSADAAPARTPRRRTTGRNRQINIKATEETIEELYRIADALDLPLGAVLERALAALGSRPQD